LTNKPFTLEEAHNYWRSPGDGKNAPENYLMQRPDLQKRDRALLELLERNASRDARILEIGCNSGRNLRSLMRAGYRDLSGIEISQAAVDVMKKMEPAVYRATRVTVGEAEALLGEMKADDYDVILSTAVLVHIPPEGERLFKSMTVVAKTIVLVEFERAAAFSSRHSPRSYREVFETLGMRQIEEIHPVSGFPKSYVGRVFRRS